MPPGPPDARLLALLAAFAARRHPAHARLRLAVLWLLLASRLAAGGRNDARRPAFSDRRVPTRRPGVRLARGSLSGRRPRG